MVAAHQALMKSLREFVGLDAAAIQIQRFLVAPFLLEPPRRRTDQPEIACAQFLPHRKSPRRIVVNQEFSAIEIDDVLGGRVVCFSFACAESLEGQDIDPDQAGIERYSVVALPDEGFVSEQFAQAMQRGGERLVRGVAVFLGPGRVGEFESATATPPCAVRAPRLGIRGCNRARCRFQFPLRARARTVPASTPWTRSSQNRNRGCAAGFARISFAENPQVAVSAAFAWPSTLR